MKPLAKRRTAIVRELQRFLDEWLKKFSMQWNKDAGELFWESFAVFVTYRHNGLLKILDNISVILSTKKYDTDTSLSFFIPYKPLVQQKASLTW